MPRYTVFFFFLFSKQRSKQSSQELNPCFLIQTLFCCLVKSFDNSIARLIIRHGLLVSDLVKEVLQAVVGLEISWCCIDHAEKGAHTKKEDDRLHCLVE